jgi:hypothetical protein
MYLYSIFDGSEKYFKSQFQVMTHKPEYEQAYRSFWKSQEMLIVGYAKLHTLDQNCQYLQQEHSVFI